MNGSYVNVYDQPGEKRVFCYRTGLTVYEEVFSGGRLLAAGWNAAGYPLNVLGSFDTRLRAEDFARPEAFGLEADGADCASELTLEDFRQEATEAGLRAVLTLRQTRKKLLLRVVTELDGTGVLTRRLEVTNEGTAPVALNALSVMSGGMDRTHRADFGAGERVENDYDLGYMDSSEWGMEGDFGWHPLTPDEHAFGGRWSRRRCRHPMFLLRSNLRGSIWIGQLAYSAGYRFAFDYDAHPSAPDSSLSFRAEIDSWKPLYVLAPGECFLSPELHLGYVQGGLDEAVNAMLDHVRKSVLTLPGTEAGECLVGSGMGPEHDMLPDTTKQFMEQMARAGAEVFIIDAGWYVSPKDGNACDLWWRCAGDWRASPDRYPGGMEEMRACAEKLGMGLGLWMEVERIGKAAAMYEAHKDWFTVHPDGERSDGYLDLTNPEVVDWCVEEVSRVIRAYGLKLFRVDYNVSGTEYFHAAENGGIRECRALRQTEGFYTLYRRLKERFPNVIFENCAGGGGRTDLGMLRAFNHTWVSDMQVAPRSVLITNGMTMALPPERVDRLVAGMGCHKAGSLDLHLRNAMLTHMTLNAFGQKDCEMNPVLFDFVEREVALYKSFIRPMLPTCRVWHHTPEAREVLKNGVCVLEDAAPDGAKGVLGVFLMPGAGRRSVTVYPRGMRRDASYRVTLDNTQESFLLSGAEARNGGIRLDVPAAMSSELLTYEKV